MEGKIYETPLNMFRFQSDEWNGEEQVLRVFCNQRPLGTMNRQEFETFEASYFEYDWLIEHLTRKGHCKEIDRVRVLQYTCDYLELELLDKQGAPLAPEEIQEHDIRKLIGGSSSSYLRYFRDVETGFVRENLFRIERAKGSCYEVWSPETEKLYLFF